MREDSGKTMPSSPFILKIEILESDVVPISKMNRQRQLSQKTIVPKETEKN
jgi:hypothetical protein